MQFMVRRVLEREGFDVTVFSEPHALIERVWADPGCFDLLVTDFSMPGMNGLEVAREVRGPCPLIPIIVATGFASDDLREAVGELGAAEILHKERTFEELGERAALAVSGERPAPPDLGSPPG